jgi:uncharacterized protein (TIGR02217 family)
MGTLTERFPVDIARGAEGGHGHFKTTIATGHGGYEDRNGEWEDARGRWNVGRAVERSGKHERVRAHFYKARGALHDFRFKDWHDFTATRTATSSNEKGRLTGSGTAWQVGKVYGADEATFEYVRPIYRLVAGTLQIWRNNTLQTLTTHYTVNENTGAVTSVSSWTGDTLECAFQFDVLCRYELDEFSARLAHRTPNAVMLFDWSRIAIIEVREA